MTNLELRKKSLKSNFFMFKSRKAGNQNTVYNVQLASDQTTIYLKLVTATIYISSAQSKKKGLKIKVSINTIIISLSSKML